MCAPIAGGHGIGPTGYRHEHRPLQNATRTASQPSPGDFDQLHLEPCEDPSKRRVRSDAGIGRIASSSTPHTVARPRTTTVAITPTKTAIDTYSAAAASRPEGQATRINSPTTDINDAGKAPNAHGETGHSHDDTQDDTRTGYAAIGSQDRRHDSYAHFPGEAGERPDAHHMTTNAPKESSLRLTHDVNNAGRTPNAYDTTTGEAIDESGAGTSNNDKDAAGSTSKHPAATPGTGRRKPPKGQRAAPMASPTVRTV